MFALHTELLDPERKKVFKKLKPFSDIGTLGGGTALMLQLNHRKSYDFDILTPNPTKRGLLLRAQKEFGRDIKPLVDTSDELTFLTPKNVKVSFVSFPFPPLHSPLPTQWIELFHLKDLASNKAYVVGRRGEYRDYVDLFFLLQAGIKPETIIREARKRFGGAFSPRLFLEQLVYFGDLKDFTVEFVGKSYTPKQILNFFKEEVKKYTKS